MFATMTAPDESRRDESIVSKMLGPLVPVHALCALLLGLRLYTRARAVNHLGWDDAAVVLAMVATTTQFALILAAVPFGVGRHNMCISPDDQLQASRLLFFSQFPWGWGVAFGKISIALLLLRLKTEFGYRVFLHAMIAVQLASAMSTNIFRLLLCRPISAAWHFHTEKTQCMNRRMVYIAAYTNGAVAVLTDLILALIPITFLGSIRRSPRERLVIAFLMALGVFAAAAEIVKLMQIRSYGHTGDTLWDCVGLVTWSILEAQMGIVAACVPCLKSPLQTALRRISLLRETSFIHHTSYADDFRVKDAVSRRKDAVSRHKEISRGSATSSPIE